MKKQPLSILDQLLTFDAECQQQFSSLIVGIDEVGRGSAIGPVVAAAVSLPESLTPDQKTELAFLNDSKQLATTVREALSQAIQRHCLVGIGIADKEEVEQLNVHHASLLAAYRAYTSWLQQTNYPHHILLDGRAVMPNLPRAKQLAVVKGDGKSAAIAAASVIAKQYRDSQIIALAKQYPGYGWETNIGYPTPAHQRAIQQLGLTQHHRKTYKIAQTQLNLSLAE